MTFYPYISHYLYDMLMMLMMLLMGRQLFNLTMSKKQVVLFIVIMMFFYQLNFYVIEEHFHKGLKYPVLYLGLIFTYVVVVRLNLISACIVILTTSALNGIWTNINIIFMLTFFYNNYGQALEAKHTQYTFYVITVCVLSSIVLLFKVKIFDIQKYN